MFILVAYKDAPELSLFSQRSMSSTIVDQSVEKTLLVNPKCYVRIMLEYIRKKCKLGPRTNFDLADQNGTLRGLFDMPTFAYATDRFEHKRMYYLIVLIMEPLVVLPQLNHENVMYQALETGVKHHILSDSITNITSTPTSTNSRQLGKKADKKVSRTRK